MAIKIAISIIIALVLFGCTSGVVASKQAKAIQDSPDPVYQPAGEFRHLTTIGGHGQDVFRTRYKAFGMTYEAVYIVTSDVGTGSSKVVSMQVINLTKDSLDVAHNIYAK